MSRREIRIFLILSLLLAALALAQFMTFNRMTTMGWATAISLVLLCLLGEVMGLITRTALLEWGAVLCALLCLALAALFQFSPPRPEPGLFVDTSHAWEKYEGARRNADQP